MSLSKNAGSRFAVYGSCSLLLLCSALAGCGGGATADEPASAPAQPQTQASSEAAPDGMVKIAAAAPTELALIPIKASASSQERPDLGPDKAIDRNNASRWSSAFSDTQDLSLDFGKRVVVTRLLISWENAHALQYEIQSSEDGQQWVTRRVVNDSKGGQENVQNLDAAGRYLRIKGVKRSSPYGYSIFELQAFAAAGGDGDPPPPPPPPNDPTQPGQLLKPLAASSSALENPATGAAQAIDGNPATRWSSAADDRAWLQFDLGAVREVGYMKLAWENAYGRMYEIQSSIDGLSWTTVRRVEQGQGGTEEFFNLRAQGRYLRIQGIQRATAYGYSLFEVEIKSSGVDNTPAQTAGAAHKFPLGEVLPQALFEPQAPIETLQFSLPDGTLITRFGNRAQNRHSRERGEEWNELGFGVNETINPVTGLPQDKGPGDYLNFVPQYFQYRSWGVEIVDNSRVAGVTQPSLRFNLYNNSIEFKNDSIAYFRAFDNPNVTGYGWMNGSNFATDASKPFQTDRCAPVPIPAGPVLGAPLCYTLVTEYPRHAALDAQGLPIAGQVIAARPLRRGDFVEVSPSYFVEDAALRAKGDPGNARYYSGEWVYVVGQGLSPWYGLAPRLNSTPLPAETLSGGSTSLSYNYSDNGRRMFEQPANNIGMLNMQRFVEGRRLLHTDFFSGQHSEAGNLDYPPAKGLAGPFFGKSNCMACHTNNGRSEAANSLDQRLDHMVVKTAFEKDGKQFPHPIYGESIQMNAKSKAGLPQDWGQAVKLAGFDLQTMLLADGSKVELRKPQLAFDGPTPAQFSLRSAMPMIGVGLLEAVAEADILARTRTSPDADGVQGIANFIYDPETGAARLGRFGWKASKVNLRHQAAAALLHDMSVTTPVYPNKSCHTGAPDCRSGARSEPGLSEAELQRITQYLALLAVPAQRSLVSGFPKNVAPLPEHRVDPAQVSWGRKVFETAKCAACHTPEMKTANTHPFAELRGQTIRPFTNLLLHDMGPGLADNLSEGRASGRHWRTPALWGLGYTPWVQEGESKVGYLHDGRARNLTEAVLWHGGEAERSRQSFQQLATTDREALLAFLRSL
jgi:CxxC motif-containing protein (DUF1111 family)